MSKAAAPKTKSGTQTIFWWIVWISLTIASFFAASAFWTPIIAKHFGSVRETKASIIWVTAVFGSWMVILVPLIVLMYSKVDKAYEDARIRREKNESRFRSIFVEPSKRRIPDSVAQKLAAGPETIEGGYLVHAKLADGRRIENVFISSEKEILGLYNAASFSFEGRDVVDVEPVDWNQPPSFLTNFWLRLDGVQPAE